MPLLATITVATCGCVSAPAAVDSEKKMRIYRKVSGLTTEQILCQDEDGDT